MTNVEPVTITLPAARQAEDHTTYDRMSGFDGGMSPAEECASCDKPFVEGAPVRQVGAEWLHELCALAAIQGTTPDLAWLILAEQVVARPSAFRASDIKAILRNVAVIARRGLVEGAS